MSIVKIRAVVSLLLVVLFVIVLLTGIGLYLAPSDRIAKEIDWNFLGMSKWKLENLHTLSGFIMSLLLIVHLILNYKLLLTEIRMLFRKS